MSLPTRPAGRGIRHPWSFQIAIVAGIPVRIHFTFLLFLGWITLSGWDTHTLGWTVFVISVFGCVLLHELGHALVARHLGVETREITLYPIGGIASLDGRPKPKEELWISLAGPAVNFALAIVLALCAFLFGKGSNLFSLDIGRSNFFGALIIANLALAVFNLIPAFPMDGGRVLRALLGLRMSEEKSTQIAAGIAQGLAIVFGIIGLFGQGYILMLIAFLVFLAASQEVSATMTRSILHGHVLADVMQTNVQCIASGQTLQSAATMMIHGSQHDFPVLNGEEVLGILTRSQLAQGLSSDGPNSYVAGWMLREYKIEEPESPLEAALDLFPPSDPSPILVLQDDTLIGMVTLESISEFVMLEHAKSRNQATENAANPHPR